MIEKYPLVSVNIPTYNEEKALPLALESVKKQQYPNLELIVIDSNSIDNTKKIALKYGAKVINYDGKLLGARYIGFKESRGQYILLLDADQVLKKDAIPRAVNKMKDFDMLVLEEDSYKPKSYIQKQLCKERKFTHANINALDPTKGGLLPRFFKRDILKDAFNHIPKILYPTVVSGDHAIIYFEAYNKSKNIGILNDSVSHIEPESIKEFLTHFYRFGKSAKNLSNTGYYDQIFTGKTQRRRNAVEAIKNKMFILAILQTMAFRLGYYFG